MVAVGVGIGHWLPLYASTSYRNAFLVTHRCVAHVQRALAAPQLLTLAPWRWRMDRRLVFKACVAGVLWLMHRAPAVVRKAVLWTCQRRPVTFIATVSCVTVPRRTRHVGGC